MTSENNLNQDGLHTADVARLRPTADIDAEEFTVRYQPKDRLLILKVNGIERNKIVLNYAEERFDELLNWAKNKFISWRGNKNGKHKPIDTKKG